MDYNDFVVLDKLIKEIADEITWLTPDYDEAIRTARDILRRLALNVEPADLTVTLQYFRQKG